MSHGVRYEAKCDFPGCDNSITCDDPMLLPRLMEVYEWSKLGGADFCLKHHPEGAQRVRSLTIRGDG